MKLEITLTLSTLAMAIGCAAEEQSDDAFRVLPIAAVMANGDEVLVGTYDEESREIELVPAFVDEVESLAEGTLHMVGADHTRPLAVRAVWTEGLEEGSALDLMTQAGTQRTTGGQLVVHGEEWTDGLTEAEAAGTFAACWDPECWFIVCEPAVE